MRKLIVTLIIAAFSAAFAANAQDSKRVLWGVKAGVDIELPGKWHGDHSSVKMFKPGIGFSAGAVCNIDLGYNTFFEPGLGLFHEQYRYDEFIVMGDNGQPLAEDPKVSKTGLMIPLIFGYSFWFNDDAGLRVYTGPQLRYAFDGNIDIDVDEADFSIWDGQRRFDASWKVGLGMPFNHFMVSLEVEFGMANLLKNELKFSENRVGLGLSYYF